MSHENVLLPRSQERIRSRTFHRDADGISSPIIDIHGSIDDAFQRQVERYGEKTAVIDDAGQLTFRELDRKANQLAVQMRSLRKPGAVAAILVENSTSAVVAMLAAVKAGSVLVNLDPRFPNDRLAYILNDSQSAMLIADERTAELAQELADDTLPIVDISRAAEATVARCKAQTSSDSLAHIVYTSGSTGRPKGILHNHANLLHNIRNYTLATHVCPMDRTTLLHSCAFSSGLVDVFLSLLNGASLHIWDFHKRGLAGLKEWVVEHDRFNPMALTTWVVGALAEPSRSKSLSS